MDNFIIPEGFNLNNFVGFADSVITSNYNSDQLQKKHRHYLGHLQDALKKSQLENASSEEIFCMNETEIIELLKTGTDKDKKIVDQMEKKKTALESIQLIKSNYEYMERLWHSASFYKFDFIKLVAEKDFSWKMKIEVKAELSKSYHRYNAAFTYNPSGLFKSLRQLNDERKDIVNNPQMDMLGEKKEKVEKVDQRMDSCISDFWKTKNVCNDIRLKITTKKSEWKNMKVVDFGDTDDDFYYIDGAVLEFHVPAHVVNKMNDMRMNFKNYAIRLTPIS